MGRASGQNSEGSGFDSPQERQVFSFPQEAALPPGECEYASRRDVRMVSRNVKNFDGYSEGSGFDSPQERQVFSFPQEAALPPGECEYASRRDVRMVSRIIKNFDG
ncbi:uncharacterized protein LOC128166441 [Crassostrea angulata]|uniref:uncharacterized protein LOC128166441 n=1 Tax=Magallana angulata TaxID=2784310 RepID=UPI00148A91F9|nr:uncharacterized protein LOC117683719 [Crassostrea gigas]XP_052687571.1 uncharacterized protein LOC128166441 [Crassostrea angulata]